MVKVFFLLKVEINMQVNLKIIMQMDLEHFNGLMDINMKDNSSKIQNKDKEYINLMILYYFYKIYLLHPRQR